MSWKCELSEDDFNIDIMSNGHRIATVYCVDDTDSGQAFEQQIVNVKLIIAAPGLFNAMMQFLLISNEKT